MPTFFLKVFWDAKIPPHCSFSLFSRVHRTPNLSCCPCVVEWLSSLHVPSDLFISIINFKEQKRERERGGRERESSIEARMALLLSEIDEQIPRLINVVCRASRAAISGCLLNQPRTPRSSHWDKRCLYGKQNKSKSHIQRLIYWPLTLRAKSSSTFMWILLNALFLVLL